jgi:hypothetical protein
MRKRVPAKELTADLNHIARSLAKVRDPVKRYLITLLVEIIADHYTERDAAAAVPAQFNIGSHRNDRPRGKPN